MSKYTLILSKKADKILHSFSDNIANPIYETISDLANNPRPMGYIKLHGMENTFRVRSGNYRIVYEIIDDKLIIHIINIGHRKDIYKNN